MSGIVGIINLDGQPISKELLAQLSSRLAHRGPDGEGTWVHGQVGLACQLFRVTPESALETQPMQHASGAVVVFDGRLDNREELLNLLKGDPHVCATSPDPALVLASHIAWGDKFPARLQGDFALGLYNPSRGQLILVRDAIGIRPLYYCQVGDTFLFASEVKAILAHPRVAARPNDHMLAHFLLGGLGCDHHDLTCFAGICSVPPGHQAVVTPAGITVRQYWDFDPSHEVRFQSFGEYAEAFGHLFKQAVGRRLRSASPVAVSVSGGLDSSAIFCQAETLRRESSHLVPEILGISEYYAEGSPADEIRFIQEFEQAYGLVVTKVPGETENPGRSPQEAVWHLEVPDGDSWSWDNRLKQQARSLGARALLTGHWGDQVLFGLGYLIDLARRFRWGEVGEHLKEINRWCPDVSPRTYQRLLFQELFKAHVPHRLTPLLRRLRDLVAPQVVTVGIYTKAFRDLAYHGNGDRSGRGWPNAHSRTLYQEIRSRARVFSMEWHNKLAAMEGLETSFPFLDRDLVAFMMAIPGEIQAWQGVPKILLREGLKAILPQAIQERRGKADFTHITNKHCFKNFNDNDIVNVLKGGQAVQRGYIDGQALRRELVRLQQGVLSDDCLTTWSLQGLIGLELWLQNFFVS
jgi:asparagine synthase (glutamine-hydrolysing)